jgi:hypothetical protein
MAPKLCWLCPDALTTINHLHGITGLEEFGPDLYKQLAK